jgi:phage-related protein
LNLFELVGDVTIRTADAIAGLNNVENATTRVGGMMDRAGQSMQAFGMKMAMVTTVPILGFLGASVKSASDLGESVSKTGYVFGKNSDEILKWSDTTLKSMGLSKATALDMAATYGDMGSSMGLSGRQATDMSKGLVKMTADMASFKNLKPAEIHTALSAVFTGETESLKRLGVVMTETNLVEFARKEGITKSMKEMSQAEKVQLRYNYVMAMTKNSTDDFSRTQDSTANQMRIFTEGIKELQTKLGAVLLPVVTKVISIFNGLMGKLMDMNPHMTKVVVVVGLIVSAIAPLIIIAGALVSAIGAIIGVIGVISIKVVLIVGAIAGLIAILGAVIIKTGLWKDIVEVAKNVISNVTEIVKNFIGALKTGADPITALSYALSKWVGSNTELGKSIMAVGQQLNAWREKIQEVFVYVFNTISKIMSDIWSVLSPFFSKIYNEVAPHLANIAKEVMTIFTIISSVILEKLQVIKGVWDVVWPYLKPVVDLVLNNIATFVSYIFSMISKAFTLLRQLITGDWSGMWETIKSMAVAGGQLLLGLIKNYIDAFVGFWGELPSKIGNIISKLHSSAVSLLSNLGSDMLKWGKNLINMLYDGFMSGVEKVKNAVSNLASGVKKFIGFESPTEEGAGKNADKWMPNLMNMLVDGIDKNKGGLQKATKEVADMLQFKGGTEFNIKTGFGQGFNPNPKYVILQINNPKIFDTADIDKFMNPVVQRLRRVGVGL